MSGGQRHLQRVEMRLYVCASSFAGPGYLRREESIMIEETNDAMLLRRKEKLVAGTEARYNPGPSRRNAGFRPQFFVAE
jgi:hypothetical protein